jgi:hypothetical protein
VQKWNHAGRLFSWQVRGHAPAKPWCAYGSYLLRVKRSGLSAISTASDQVLRPSCWSTTRQMLSTDPSRVSTRGPAYDREISLTREGRCSMPRCSCHERVGRLLAKRLDCCCGIGMRSFRCQPDRILTRGNRYRHRARTWLIRLHYDVHHAVRIYVVSAVQRLCNVTCRERLCENGVPRAGSAVRTDDHSWN